MQEEDRGPKRRQKGGKEVSREVSEVITPVAVLIQQIAAFHWTK